MTSSVAVGCRMCTAPRLAPKSPVEASGLRFLMEVAASEASPVRRHATVAVAAELDERGDRRPGGEGEKCDDEYHGRNATFIVEPPRVAEKTLSV